MSRKGAIAFVVCAMVGARTARADERAEPWEHRAEWTLSAVAFIGDALRFDDPFRLATPLGRSAESVSRAAAYTEVGASLVRGDPLGVQHGVSLRAAFALEGVHQTVITPSYEAWHRTRDWGVFARLGVPIVLRPDVTWGLEAAGGAVLFVRAGVGIGVEVVGDVFYGAATREVAAPAYPMLGAQLGLVAAYEILP